MRMLPFMAIALGLAITATRAQSVPAQATPPSAAPNGGRADIVVSGTTKKAVEEAVRHMTLDTGATGQIARWNDTICVNVANLDQPYAGYVIDRTYTVAEQLGLKTGRDDCKPNILVVMTTEPDGVVRQLGKLGIATKDEKALLEPRPVRWYSASESRDVDGRPIHGFNPGALDINRTLAPASRISEVTREATVALVIIVDFGRIHDVQWPQLADYLAMVAIGKPAFGPDYGGPSILALFKDRDEGSSLPAGLTTRDQGYLKGLYTSFDLTRGESQRAAIREAMRKGATLGEPKQ